MKALERQRLMLVLLFLVPGMAYLVLLRLAPAVFTLALSLTDWNLVELGGPTFVGFQNYIRVLQDTAFLESVGRTVLFTIVATAVELVLGLALALLIHRDFRGKGAARAMLLTPMVITPAVVGLIWYILFHQSIGPLNWLLSLAGLDPVRWLSDPDVALISLIITDVWHWTPFMFLLCLAALQMIPQELYEAAQVDGASPGQALVYLTLPMIRDTLIVATILRSIEAFEIFAEPFVMTGGGPGRATETLSLHIYKSAFLFFEMGYAGAMIVISIAMISLIYVVYLRFVRFD
jgi:multiple sugar transport system permease protein